MRRLAASAPARANLIGNPSDLYGGATLGCSVPLRAEVILEESAELELCAGGERRAVRGPADLEPRGDALDLGRAALRSLPALPHARIRYATEIPLRSGLAGSTSLLVALLHALDRWSGVARAPHALAEHARAVERRLLGITCGYVDQYLCVFGGLQYVDLRGKEWESEDPPLATVEPLAAHVAELPFLLGFTGVRHDSGAVHSPIRARWESGEREVVEGYSRLAALALEAKRAMLGADWRSFGALMNENHAIQRGFGGSGPANEELIAAALGAGALGAKLAGAGHGGTIVALCPGTETEVEAALRRAGASQIFRPVPVEGVRVDSAAPAGLSE
jgi:galactokinase/mevalonate kinase-like predicted kinase